MKDSKTLNNNACYINLNLNFSESIFWLTSIKYLMLFKVCHSWITKGYSGHVNLNYSDSMDDGLVEFFNVRI